MRNYFNLRDYFDATDPYVAAGVQAAYADATADAMRKHADRYAAAGYGVLAAYLRDAARARDYEG